MNLILNPELKRKIGARIKSARKHKGYKAQEFVDTLSDEDEGKLYARYTKWESGKNAVPVEAIPALCAALDCDVGYLFGEYEEFTRQSSDICTETGLTQESVDGLKKPGIVEALNALLSSPRGRSCLRSILAYISVPEASGDIAVTDKGEVVAPTVWDLGLASFDNVDVGKYIDQENGQFANYTRIGSASRLAEQAFMSDVETDLKDLRAEFKQSSGYSYSAQMVTRRSLA